MISLLGTPIPVPELPVCPAETNVAFGIEEDAALPGKKIFHLVFHIN